MVDEAHHTLRLDDEPAQRPFASFAKDAITVGSASKSVWGGLRLGWIRAPHHLVDPLTRARVGLDLGAPVLEQLVLTRLVTGEFDAVLAAHRRRLRVQRDALVAALAKQLPDWTFRKPAGGMALWCHLPQPRERPRSRSRPSGAASCSRPARRSRPRAASTATSGSPTRSRCPSSRRPYDASPPPGGSSPGRGPALRAAQRLPPGVLVAAARADATVLDALTVNRGRRQRGVGG